MVRNDLMEAEECKGCGREIDYFLYGKNRPKESDGWCIYCFIKRASPNTLLRREEPLG